MKFKYYLKGLGMGIIFATLIMTVSGVIHNKELSDKEIIERAGKLGMVLPGSEKESVVGLFGNKEDSESGDDTETESDSQRESESESESESSSETQTEIIEYVLHITWGDTPKLIAKELEENGIIEDWSGFRDYLDENGYAKKLQTCSYTIRAGMSYEEIAKIITKS